MAILIGAVSIIKVLSILNILRILNIVGCIVNLTIKVETI